MGSVGHQSTTLWPKTTEHKAKKPQLILLSDYKVEVYPLPRTSWLHIKLEGGLSIKHWTLGQNSKGTKYERQMILKEIEVRTVSLMSRKEAITDSAQKEGKQDYRTAPAVTGINMGPPTQQQLHNLHMPLTCCDMQRGPPIQVYAIHIYAFIQQVLNSIHITSTRHEQQLHRRVQVLWNREPIVLLWAPSYGIERGLPPKAEPQIVALGI